jgi:hypothetical protein
MSKWKATLPRSLPAKGQAHFVLAMKDSNGGRFEISGTAESKLLAPILGDAVLAIRDKAETRKVDKP